MIRRRSFLYAPAIVAAASLMPISTALAAPKLRGDGITDDTEAIRALVKEAIASKQRIYLPPGRYLIKSGALLP